MTLSKLFPATRRAIALVIAGIAVFASPAIAADAPGANVMLDRLEGAWGSDGDAFGLPAHTDMNWDLALDGQFTRLDYRIEMRLGGDETRTFSGVAFYDRIKGVAAFWADSRGDLHPIRVETKADALIAHWGVEGGKQGRTRYEILGDGGVKVTDWILRDGEWRQFNENVFTRVKKIE